MNYKGKGFIDCTDVYLNEIDRTIKTLKRMREAWLRVPSCSNYELFQYAEDDFYLYRFFVNALTRNTNEMVEIIIYQLLQRYHVEFRDDYEDFSFVIEDSDNRIGYRFDDFYGDDDVDEILRKNEVDKGVIIRNWKDNNYSSKKIKRENSSSKYNNLISVMLLKEFFLQYFDLKEYELFYKYIEEYIVTAKDVLGYKTVKYLSNMNLATQKICAEKEILEWDYCNYAYKIIDDTNEKISKLLYVQNIDLERFHDEITTNYLTNSLYKSIVGVNEYSCSFITSEWLYHSLKEKKNYDYTAVISGYLKSIEQLLHKIVMVNLNNNCRIAINNEIQTEIEKNNISLYYYDLKRKKWKNAYPNTKYKYIDLNSENEKYMDTSIGTYEYFLRVNRHIFIDESLSDIIADMVSCFRIECRNGYFHRHNLQDWEIVEITRNNALYLYYLLLGGCVIPESQMYQLGMCNVDEFDELCKKIREFRRYRSGFVFEYENRKTIKVIYDTLNNVMEFSTEGREHYQSLLFYEVDDFSVLSYEKLEMGISEGQMVYLTRDSLPKKIYGYYKDGELIEIKV